MTMIAHYIYSVYQQGNAVSSFKLSAEDLIRFTEDSILNPVLDVDEKNPFALVQPNRENAEESRLKVAPKDSSKPLAIRFAEDSIRRVFELNPVPYQSKNRDTDRHTNGDADRVIGRDYHWGNTDKGDTPHGPPVTRTPTDTPTETLIDTLTENAGDDKDLFAPFRTFRRACRTSYYPNPNSKRFRYCRYCFNKTRSLALLI